MKLTFNKLTYVPAFALTLGLCGLALPALAGQDQNPNQSQARTERSQKAHQTKSVTGCLEQGATNGTFMITSKDGQKYQLQPMEGVKLASHVNHEVTVRGMVAPAGSQSGTMSGSESSRAGQTGSQAGSAREHGQMHPAMQLQVKSLKMVSTSCQQ